MKNRKYYENLFADYPSVVTLTQFRGMLIPKDWVIDYVLSEHYAEYKEQLKVQV